MSWSRSTSKRLGPSWKEKRNGGSPRSGRASRGSPSKSRPEASSRQTAWVQPVSSSIQRANVSLRASAPSESACTTSPLPYRSTNRPGSRSASP